MFVNIYLVLFSALYQLRYDFRALHFCFVSFYCNFVAFVSFVFCFRCIFSKGNQYIYSALAQLYLLIKVNVLLSLAKAWEVEMRVSKGVHF